MKYLLYTIALLGTFNLRAQSIVELKQELEGLYIDNEDNYVSNSVMAVIDDFPFEIKGYNILAEETSLVENYGINAIVLFAQEKEGTPLENVFSGSISNSSIAPVSLVVYLESATSHSYYNSKFSNAAKRDNWTSWVKEELSLSKYTVKSLKVSGG